MTKPVILSLLAKSFPWMSLSFLLGFAFVPLGQALADVVLMNDGRRYEGTILSKTDEIVSIDAKVEGVRVKLGLRRLDIKSIDEKPVPANFYDKPAAEQRVSDPKSFKPGQTLYLEVPIIGVIGKQVFADAVSAALAYAKRHGIGHLVFHIDSEGGSIDEAREIYSALKEYRESIKYHAIVGKCRGEALAVAVWCRPNLILPGGKFEGLPYKVEDSASGKIEGSSAKTEGPTSGKESEEEEILRSQMAQRIVADTGASGPIASLIRALVNPGEELAAWKDDEGKIAFDAKPPAGIPRERLIFSVARGEVLSLTREQGLALGMPDFKGGAADLGKLLKLPDWAAESNYGTRTMTRVAAEKERKAAAKEAAHELKLKQVVTRRDAVEKFIQESLRQAAEWDPEKGSYSNYEEKYDWGWGWKGGWTSNKWTPESQRQWTSRTDACRFYLRETAKGLKSMKRLDAEAVKAGLDPLYKPGEIDTMIRDLDVRYRNLGQSRKKSSD